MLTGCLGLACSTGNGVVLVRESIPVSTILVAEDAPALTRESAERLAYYIQRISEAEIQIEHQLEAVKTPSVIWVGDHPQIVERHPQFDAGLSHPEETLRLTLGEDLILIGMDEIIGEHQVQAGTYMTVSTFIEEQLGVRWFWPGELGTDIPQRQTIEMTSLNERYTPQLKLRSLRLANNVRTLSSLRNQATRKELQQYIENPRVWAQQRDAETKQWLNNHRGDARATGETMITPLMGSWFHYRNRHAFTNWFINYGKQHPEWFALQPDGHRAGVNGKPYPDERNVKMCVSNPEVADQWMKDAKEFFERNPLAKSESAAERDYGWQGYCVCKECLAMDNKRAEMLENPIRWATETRPFYALTDRYAKFWNILGKRLKEEFPDRELYVSTYAYHVTRPAPTIKLEDNIIPTFVGLERRFYNRNSDAHTADQRRMWKEWWEAVNRKNMLIWRPNMIYRTLGLPYIFTRRHAENMKFMADHGLVGVVTNSSYTHWATQGPQLYLNAKLLWDPYADAEEIMTDYYQRAFGPAAPYIREYFGLYEELYDKLANQYEKLGYHTFQDPPRLFREIRLDRKPATARLGQERIKRHYHYEKQAQRLLEKAREAVEDGPEAYRERVVFFTVGFEFIVAQLDCIDITNQLRVNNSRTNRDLLKEAVTRRSQILGLNAYTPAFDYLYLLREIEERSGDLGIIEEDSKQDSEESEEELIHNLEA